MSNVRDIPEDLWKIVLVKTIDGTEPIYYRLANLSTYQTQDVPAYRILDEVINNKKNIINLRCRNNLISIVDSNGYENTDELIQFDEFDDSIPTLLEWAMSQGELGTKILNRFDTEKNSIPPSNIKINSTEQIAWTCEKGHTIYCDFAVYFSIKFQCPMCKTQENNHMLSFRSWANFTKNQKLLQEYDAAQNNKVYSSDIGWKQRNKVWFRRGDEEVSESLYNITVKNIEPPFSNNSKEQ